MFFILSKIVWFFVQPANVLFFLLVAGAALLWTPWKRVARWIITATAVFSLLVATVPVSAQFNLFLEDRIPVPKNLPADIDGIIVLGGAVDQYLTRARGEISVGASFERVLRFVSLAQAYPEAKLVYSGGSGLVSRQDIKEADVVAPLLQQMGVDTSRVVTESQSRNTYENALYSLDLIKPGPDEKWILVTSAAHMPRALGCFRQVGWPGLIPYPTDYTFEGNESFGLSFNFGEGLYHLSRALHDLLGLTAYYLTGKTDALIPAP